MLEFHAIKFASYILTRRASWHKHDFIKRIIHKEHIMRRMKITDALWFEVMLPSILHLSQFWNFLSLIVFISKVCFFNPPFYTILLSNRYVHRCVKFDA